MANRDPAMDNKELIEKVRSALAEAIGNVINETIAGIVKEVCDQVSSPRPRVISKMAKNLQTGDRVELTSGMVISMSCALVTAAEPFIPPLPMIASGLNSATRPSADGKFRKQNVIVSVFTGVTVGERCRTGLRDR